MLADVLHEEYDVLLKWCALRMASMQHVGSQSAVLRQLRGVFLWDHVDLRWW